MIKGEKVIIETFSEDQIAALLRQPYRQTFTGLRDYTLMLLLLETGVPEDFNPLGSAPINLEISIF